MNWVFFSNSCVVCHHKNVSVCNHTFFFNDSFRISSIQRANQLYKIKGQIGCILTCTISCLPVENGPLPNHKESKGSLPFKRCITFNKIKIFHFFIFLKYNTVLWIPTFIYNWQKRRDWLTLEWLYVWWHQFVHTQCVCSSLYWKKIASVWTHYFFAS